MQSQQTDFDTRFDGLDYSERRSPSHRRCSLSLATALDSCDLVPSKTRPRRDTRAAAASKPLELTAPGSTAVTPTRSNGTLKALAVNRSKNTLKSLPFVDDDATYRPLHGFRYEFSRCNAGDEDDDDGDETDVGSSVIASATTPPVSRRSTSSLFSPRHSSVGGSVRKHRKSYHDDERQKQIQQQLPQPSASSTLRSSRPEQVNDFDNRSWNVGAASTKIIGNEALSANTERRLTAEKNTRQHQLWASHNVLSKCGSPQMSSTALSSVGPQWMTARGLSTSQVQLQQQYHHKPLDEGTGGLRHATQKLSTGKLGYELYEGYNRRSDTMRGATSIV